MLPGQVDSSVTNTNNPLEYVDQVHTIYTLRFPKYMLLASIGTCYSSTQIEKVILDTG